MDCFPLSGFIRNAMENNKFFKILKEELIIVKTDWKAGSE